MIHRAADRRFVPWKNGGGRTAEVLAHPAGAGLEAFDWRISTAVVAASGPFSLFPGIDRVLTVLEGGAMELIVEGAAPRRLGVDTPPFAFPGDRPCTATLLGTALLDLNVMVRRPFRARVARDCLRDSTGVVARYLFATAPVPSLGLERHDLMETGPDADPLRDKGPFDSALVIEISR